MPSDLYRYCGCFASGSYCNGCNCLNCHNTLEKETERQEAIKAILERKRNPDAFKPKIAGSPHGTNDLQVSSCYFIFKLGYNAKCETDTRRKNEKVSSLDPAQRDANENEINDSPDCVIDAVRMDEKPISPATRALMCDEEHVNISEKETSARMRTTQDKEVRDTSSEVYLEQEKQIFVMLRRFTSADFFP
ncbi:Protein tesmin/TSO1-like CXC 7 [Raphanus sativus]|nr:Protein tesmin/TSO1-like CXC 7 [Raphanus sativus]